LSAPKQNQIERRVVGGNVWLGRSDLGSSVAQIHPIYYEILQAEESVGSAQWQEIERAADEKEGDLVIILLGGRGQQAMYKQVAEIARTREADELLGRLHVFTQDALAPMRMDNGLSFVRDFERLLGEDFFKKVKSFTPMRTDTDDLEGELVRYLEKLESLGGIDIFFLGMGPEPGEASHLAYIKPGSGADAGDLAGIIPISPSILEHHISKFKIGGSSVTHEDEAECRAASYILTLGPAAILGARRIVQSIVDASTSPAKPASYKRLLETEISDEPAERARQLDENPGLWLRLHPNVRSLVLPDVLQA
jgi:6-phosphogluconolactonase/glucosamine-6-phosphate isomerase/deaminase